MQSSEIRKKFFEFFAKHNHMVVPSSSLIPDDPSVLLTTAGMQQFKPYYTGDADPMTSVHPMLGKPLGSKNAASIQKSFRTSDIDEVGDETHLTFFEMLGNFSFGGYFKKEAIKYGHDFITQELGLAISYVTIFKGSDAVPKDTESEKIWKSLGVADVREEGMEDVFWGPTGASGPCGPTTEIYCTNANGKDVEIWNIVFNEFLCDGSREQLLAGSAKLTPLEKKGIDTGMGLERLAMISQNKKNIFETDLFAPIVELIPNGIELIYKRIISDHIRAITFLIGDGLRPGNKEASYILRRLIRRVVLYEHRLKFNNDVLQRMIREVIQHYSNLYSEFFKGENTVFEVFSEEQKKFRKLLVGALKRIHQLADEKEGSPQYAMRMTEDFGKKSEHYINLISGAEAFKLYESYGIPPELINDELAQRGLGYHKGEFEEAFESARKKHQEISRAGATAKFGGHGLYMKTGEVTIRDESEVEKVTRLHTATHLMHAALRAVLGPEVRQDGSDITVERTRFDFRFGRKVMPDELKKVEQWVNDAVEKDLAVKCEEMSYEEAVGQGALGFFHEKYPLRVKVYTVFDPNTEEVCSKELCGGPHVAHTGEVGRFRITKEESSSAGVRRIRGVVE